MNITETSKAVFLRHAKDAGNWSGTPVLDITKEQRGNLTQLKRAGLCHTFESDGVEFMQITPEGIRFAREHGVMIDA